MIWIAVLLLLHPFPSPCPSSSCWALNRACIVVARGRHRQPRRRGGGTSLRWIATHPVVPFPAGTGRCSVVLHWCHYTCTKRVLFSSLSSTFSSFFSLFEPSAVATSSHVTSRLNQPIRASVTFINPFMLHPWLITVLIDESADCYRFND